MKRIALAVLTLVAAALWCSRGALSAGEATHGVLVIRSGAGPGGIKGCCFWTDAPSLPTINDPEALVNVYTGGDPGMQIYETGGANVLVEREASHRWIVRWTGTPLPGGPLEAWFRMLGQR